MAENKTQKTTASVAAFLAALPDAQQRKDAQALAAMMRATTGEAPAMWGSAIVGYGDMRYQGASRGGDWFPVGFSPRKSALTVYLMDGVRANPDLLAKLGPHKVGGGCLYLTKFCEVDMQVLEKLVARAYKANMKAAPKAEPAAKVVKAKGAKAKGARANA